ncbi:MAG: alpha/beta hydrolase [Bifidobacterium thermophilum]|nr:alpha/beta hydrolase [Bifidobacterium thermophilum]
MTWQVTSRISGGPTLSVPDAQQFQALIASLEQASRRMTLQARLWSEARERIVSSQLQSGCCPANRQISPGGHSNAINAFRHIPLRHRELSHWCDEQTRDCHAVAARLDTLSRLVARAHGLYLDAEHRASSYGGSIPTDPLATSAPSLKGLAASILESIGSIRAGGDARQAALEALHSTAPYHEAIMAGFSAMVLGGIAVTRTAGGYAPGSDDGTGSGTGSARRADDLFQGMLTKQRVNIAAGQLASLTASLNDNRQGNRLDLTRKHPPGQVVQPVDDIAGAIAQLRSLAESQYGTGTDNGLSYATIAIQRYRRDDGSVGWLVIVPGTDGHADSPFGWPQNIELMSSDADTRIGADSARMVMEAMDRAGVKHDDPVAVIGHSQGGIVAATLAADSGYDIRHIVTAGSPVANHPIREGVWTTSIEMDDELVAALDGTPNPASESWLTIRGSVSRQPEHHESNTADMASPVPQSVKHREMSHHLKFHQAAYTNALALGSRAVSSHDRHFSQVVGGTLEETSYWQGRMTR